MLSVKNLSQLLFAGCVVLLGANSANAVPVTLYFTGSLDFVDAALGGTFVTGQTLTGSYTFESTTAARAGSTSNSAVYDALSNINFDINGYTGASSGAPEIQVDNDPGLPFHDRYAVVSRVSDGLIAADVNGNAATFFGFRMDDSTDTVFSDALTLPTSLLLSSFDVNGFFMFFSNPSTQDGFSISGHLTALDTTVPEPTSMLLLLSGLAGGAISRRKAAKN